MSNWFKISGGEKDVAVSTRVRLARNLKQFPFVGRLTAQQSAEIYDKIWLAIQTAPDLAQQFEQVNVSALPEPQRISLVERHLISPEFALGENSRALISTDGGVSIMINEEDHLRIQVFGGGLCLEQCFEQAQRLSWLLESKMEPAFDPKLGYLTTCPTNLGTGLRASVMLHLPGLTRKGDIENAPRTAAKMGFAMRGVYGENSQPYGHMHQLSNQITLGFDEKMLIGNLHGLVGEVIEKERHAKQLILEEEYYNTLDLVSRAEGILKTCRLLPLEEGMRMLSFVWFGRATGLYDKLDFDQLAQLMTRIQPAGIIAEKGERLTEEQIQILRADITRQSMA